MGITVYSQSFKINLVGANPLLQTLDNDLTGLQHEINEIIQNNNPIRQFDLSLIIAYIQAIGKDLQNIKNSSNPQDQQIANSPTFIALENNLNQPLVDGYPSLVDACSDPNTMDELLQSLIWMQQGQSSLISVDLLAPIAQFLQAWPPGQ